MYLCSRCSQRISQLGATVTDASLLAILRDGRVLEQIAAVLRPELQELAVELAPSAGATPDVLSRSTF